MSEENYISENSATDTEDIFTGYFQDRPEFYDMAEDISRRYRLEEIDSQALATKLATLGDCLERNEMMLNSLKIKGHSSASKIITVGNIVSKAFQRSWYSVQHAWRSWFSSYSKSSSLYPVTISRNDFISKEKVEIYTDNLINIKDDIFQYCNSLKTLRIRKSNIGSNAGLATLPSSICCLTSLEILDVSGNTLGHIPSNLWELKCLQELFLNNCGIEKLSSGLKDMKFLRILYLDNNKLSFFEFSEIPPNLTQLSLSDNVLKNVSGMLTQRIESLDISRNFVEELPVDVFENATSLLSCHLGNNKLRSLPPSFINLTSIIRIIVCRNQLKSLPFDFGKLRTLRFLDISGNVITQLPESIVEFRLHEWNCEDNPLWNPPLEVALKGSRSIKTYFDSLKITPEICSKRMKIMVVGDKNAGKTSLAKALQGNPCNTAPKETTIGIDFYKWTLFDIEVLIIDCAGERKYMLTHQLFLSTGMIFAIAVNLEVYSMESDDVFNEKIGFWLELLISRIPGATIIIVPTHFDLVIKGSQIDVDLVMSKCANIIEKSHEYIKEWRENRKHYLEKEDQEPYLPSAIHVEIYGNLYTRDTFSSATDHNFNLIPVSNTQFLYGIESLKHEILKIFGNPKLCPNVMSNIPKCWSDLEKYCIHLSDKSMEFPVITCEEMFRTFGIIKSKMEFELALNYIHAVGPILYFHNIEKTRDIVFLDPIWLLKLVKALFVVNPNEQFVYKKKYLKEFDIFESDYEINKEYLLQTASIRRSLLKCVWYDFFTSDELLDQLIELFQYFGLLHEVTLEELENENERLFLAPWYLSHSPSKMPSDNCDGKAKTLWLEYGQGEDENAVICLGVLENKANENIVLKIQTCGSLPNGFFERFIIRIYSLNILVSLSPWSCGVTGRTRDNCVVTCVHTKEKHTSYVSVVATGDEEVIYHSWYAVIPIVKAFEEFLSEWRGISHRIYSWCPSCFKSGKQIANRWQFNLKFKLGVGDNKDSNVICLLENKPLKKFLMMPPTAIMFDFAEGITKRALEYKFIKDLRGEVDRGEIDEVSLLLADRSNELCRVLEINRNLLQQTYVEPRERLYDILRLWKEAVDHPTRENLIAKLKAMKPFPYGAIDVILLKTEL